MNMENLDMSQSENREEVRKKLETALQEFNTLKVLADEQLSKGDVGKYKELLVQRAGLIKDLPMELKNDQGYTEEIKNKLEDMKAAAEKALQDTENTFGLATLLTGMGDTNQEGNILEKLVESLEE